MPARKGSLKSYNPLFITVSFVSMITVNCPTCHALVQWQPENEYRPFCSERCKLIDLGAWADEQHALPALPETPEEWDALHHD